MSDLDQEKRALREKLRFRRRHFAANLDAMTRMVAFRSLPAPIADLIAPLDGIGAYVAWGDEPDILPLLADQPGLALPHHAARTETMDFRCWSPGDPLVKGPWSTQQPADGSTPAQPQLLFCPLLGFDRQGGRIGQGGGHYDRYFAARPDARRIGIGWSIQEVDAIPRESTDIALDAIWTEQEYIICGERL